MIQLEIPTRKHVVAAALLVAASVVATPGTVLASKAVCAPLTQSRRALKLNGVEVQAPTTAAGLSAARDALAADDDQQRWRAATALGLAGDLRSASRLVATGDSSTLRVFARHYANPEGHVCVPDEVERLVLAHLDEPSMRSAMLAFFQSNKYRSRKLFERLVRIRLDDGKPDAFHGVVMALTSTDMPGIEPMVLDQALGYLAHDTPVAKRVLPGIHRRYVGFLAERAYAPAIPYMEQLLEIESCAEPKDFFQAQYSQTRAQVYHALERIDSPEVGGVLVRQLERAVDECPIRLVAYELHAMGGLVIRRATAPDLRRRIGNSLAELLASENGPSPTTDYLTRKKIVELLVELETGDATAALLEELDRLAESDDPAAVHASIVNTLHNLARPGEPTALDVSRFLRIVHKLSPATQLLHVPQVLDAHPSPASHPYYLELMTAVVEKPETVARHHAIDPARTLESLIRRLLAFEEPGQLVATRAEVDRLFLAGSLDERSYRSASKRVNELSGDESPTYRELIERDRLQRLAAEREKREQARAKLRDAVDENVSPQGVRRNLQLCQTRDGCREGGAWLVIAGPDALAELHASLADPDRSMELKFRLLQILGEIGDADSIEPVIAAVRADPALARVGFRALGAMPPTARSYALASEVLAGGDSEIARQAALVYLAAVRESRAAALPREYATADQDPGIRAVALLLAARLGQVDARPAIVELLKTTDDRSLAEVLVRGLGELSTPDSFRATFDDLSATGTRVVANQVASMVGFRQASGPRRLELAIEIVQAGHPWDLTEVVHSILAEGQGGVLLRQLRPDGGEHLPFEMQMIYSPLSLRVWAAIRRGGFEVRETDGALELVRPR